MNVDLGFYWALFKRRLPVMALFVLLFSGLGLVTAFKLPETYSTSARLLFEAPQIPENMVASTVQTDAAEQLQVIEQRLMTRANLIDIANRFDVFANMREMEPDRVTAAMRDATQIRRRGGGRAMATMMTVEFEARSPQIAANVVNEYVTLVLEENSKFRTSRAENTLEFFQQEVNRLDDELDRQSVEIANFKSENAKALPEDQAYRLGRQNLLQERLDRLSREIGLAQQQRENLEKSFEDTRTSGTSERSAYEEELIIGKAELERLLETYTESNPRVIRLKDRIERLEAVVAARESGSGPDEEDSSSDQARLDAALAEVDSKINAMQDQLETTKAELEELQKNISRSAANANRLAELERDYNIIQSRYNSAVSNLNSARMSERIEATAQGQRINVIENASVPQVPSGPNRPLIAALGIFTGLGLAIGYFVLLEALNRDIRRPAELSERFNVMPIATIPYMESRIAKFLRRSTLLMATLAVLVGVPLALWYIDTNYLPLEVIVQKSLAKLGLG
ncbi:chain length-determining protein [Roseovarius sp. A21]|uniref:Chain length-determining protein n=1 Tax=Roseovarius bejariae TaxID=2576383 RepID=A0A844D1D3_9RHOB|nr:chain length-determining protein [Roseovarius bejariae]MRU15663.1 chain length-determining protein [Roseovarius bejariae]